MRHFFKSITVLSILIGGLFAGGSIVSENKEVTKVEKNNVEITASVTGRDQLVEASYNIYIYCEGERGERMTKTSHTSTDKAVSHRLPVGTYILISIDTSSYKDFEKKIPFEVKADEVTKLHVIFGQTGKIYAIGRGIGGNELPGTSCYMYNDEQRWRMPVHKKDSKPDTIEVPVGKYKLDCIYYGFHKKDIPVEVKFGKTTQADIVFGQTGKMHIMARETKGGEGIMTSCNLYSEDRSERWTLLPLYRTALKSYYKKDSKSYTEQLPVGKYKLDCEYFDYKKKDIPVEIKFGETTHIDMVFGQVGEVYATSREVEDGKLMWNVCYISRRDNSKSWHVPVYEGDKDIYIQRLPIGNYIFNCREGAFKKKDIPVEIRAGETTHVDFVLGNTAKIYVTARISKGGKLVEAFCNIFSKNKSSFLFVPSYEKDPASHSSQIPPGNYTIDCRYKKYNIKDIPVEVKDGVLNHIDVVFKSFTKKKHHSRRV